MEIGNFMQMPGYFVYLFKQNPDIYESCYYPSKEIQIKEYAMVSDISKNYYKVIFKSGRSWWIHKYDLIPVDQQTGIPIMDLG